MQKDEFIKLLKDLNISKKKFAEIADVPYPTVSNWGVSRSGKVLEIPNWVRQFLYYYDRSQKLEYLTSEICQKINDTKKDENYITS